MNVSARHLGLSFLIAVLMACSADVPQQSPPGFTYGRISAPYTFKFYVDDGKSKTLVKVVPREVANAARRTGGGETGTTTGQSLSSPGLHALDLNVLDNGPPTMGSTTEPFVVTGPESLIEGAAAECGMVNDLPQAIRSPTGPYANDPTWSDIVIQENNHQTITTMQAADLWSVELISTGGPLEPRLNYSLFPHNPATCDQMLEYEETLVCVADQLAKLADTVSPLTWHAVQFLPENTGQQPLAWVVPPPADQDRFIVRDLALEVLGELPLMDADPFLSVQQGGTELTNTSPPTTCSAAYLGFDTTATAPFTPYPPYDSNQWKTVSQERWAFEASNLRAAGQLLHDLVRESVYSDLAGSAASSGAAADPSAGQTLSLGLNPNAPYNSLAHIARVLMGRWDMDPPAPVTQWGGNPDPQCRTPVRGGIGEDYVPGPPAALATGVAELALLPQLADVGTRARANDLGVMTQSQSVAASLFEQAGLVIQDGTTVQSNVLLTQLQGLKAASQGITPAQFSQTIGGQALAQLVGSLSGADLARASQHNSTTFSLLTLQTTADETKFAAAATAAGLNPSTIANSALGNSGIAIQGGLPRSLVTADPMARVGQMMVGSQCPEPGNPLSTGGYTNPAATLLMDDQIPNAPNPVAARTLPNGAQSFAPLTPVFSRQDVFAVANAIRSRLVKLNAIANSSTSGGADPASTAAQARSAAIAELGAWAGTGRMILSTDKTQFLNGTHALPSKVYLDLIDVKPSDFGVADLTQMAGALSIVVGSAKAAECAANISAASGQCSTAGLLTANPTVSFDTFGLPRPSPSDLAKRYGVSSYISAKSPGYVRLTFAVAQGGAVGDGQGAFSGWDEPFYVVRAQDPTKASGIGEVLGALSVPVVVTQNTVTAPTPGSFARPLTAYPAATLTISPMRKELVYDAFGLGHWVGAAPPKAGDTPVSDTPSFCIEGVPRDIFVPLDNDLANSNDTYENSWSHYLALAQQAASNADSIGEELVNIGFQNDTNQEGAGIQLMNSLGSPVATSNGPNDPTGLHVDPHGNIVPGTQNGALGALLTPAIFDVVFFTQDPLGGNPTPAGLKSALQCGSSTTPLCVTLSNPATTVTFVKPGDAATLTGPNPPGTVLYTALGLANPPPPPQSTDACAQIVSSAASMKGLLLDKTGAPTFASVPFAAGTFASGIGPWANPANVQAAMNSPVKFAMKTDPTTGAFDGNWTVSYGGNPIMDSTPSTSTTPNATWPGCLAQSCNWTDPVVNSLNNLLRWCDAPNSMRSPLGTCDGGSQMAEINSLRWRIQGVLWLAAAMSGGIPDGMFTVPVPAADFPETWQGGQFGAPFNTVFSTAQFSVTGTTIGFVNGLNLSADQQASGYLNNAVALSPPNGPWYQWGPHGQEMLPSSSWLYNVYVHPQPPFSPTLIHIPASNMAGASDFSNLADFFGRIKGAAGSSNQIGPQQWVGLASVMGGPSCAAPSGAGLFDTLNGSAYGQGWLQGLVAAMKTQQAANSSMRSQLFLNESAIGDSNPFGLVSTTFAWYGQCPNSNFFGPWLPSLPWPGPNCAEQPATSFPASDPSFLWADEPPIWCAGCLGLPPVQQRPWVGQWDPQSYAGWSPPLTWTDISQLTPEVRVGFVTNAGAPRDNCDAAWQFTQAVALDCLLTTQAAQYTAGQLPQQAPPLNNLSDLSNLTGWLQSQLATANTALANSYVVHVPAMVVASAVGAPGALSGNGGSAGTDVANAANAMLGVYSQWNNVQTDAQLISAAMSTARDAIANAETQQTEQDITLTIQQLGVYKDIANDIAQIVQGVASSFSVTKAASSFGLSSAAGAAQAVAGAVGVAMDTATLPLIEKLKDLGQTDEQQKVQAALDNLHTTVLTESGNLNQAVYALRQDANTVQSSVESYASDASQASYYAGKALGLDVWNCQGSNGQALECTSHVNTVLNRRYAGFQIRYQQALTQAKALGYIARRAVEQRIGVRLSDITTPIGPLDPPSTWADQICSLQGINYQTLTQEFPDAGTPSQQQQIDGQLGQQYANAFVGDWVQKLSDFVSYYNVAYPEQDGNDTTVLSMRESLIGAKPLCLTPSPNLLLDSSRLYSLRNGAGGSLASIVGWTIDTCGTNDATCLQVRGSVAGPPPPDTNAGSISWLSDQTRPPPQNGVDPANTRALPDSADGYVSQQVVITTPGTYLLSWWDQARDANGNPTSTPGPAYNVQVFDSSWTAVAGFSAPPTPTDSAGSVWSARHVLAFQVASGDVYHIALGASGPAGPPGSVAISDVQLELAPASGAPSRYVDTGDNGEFTQYQCGLSPAEFRSAFAYTCDAQGCYYALQTPISINTQLMTSNGMPLTGKLAAGNFNFRHVDVALNVVGTGVINCTPTGSPDCFGSAYVGYTLRDLADDIGVLGYDGQYRSFDFGTAVMDHAKALTAERYLTVPLSSNDQQLVNQFLQTQFRGRPLDGTYSLRIYDSPTLNWNQVQDIQILLNYHYWSKVTPSQGSK